MRFLLGCCFLVFAFAAGLAGGAGLPKEIVGVWATDDSEFDQDRLIGGSALYILESGAVALVGAPLPVRRCADGRVCTPIIGFAGRVAFDAATGKLDIALQGSQQSRAIGADYNARDGAILLHTNGSEAQLLRRRKAEVPAALEKHFGGG